MADIKQTQDHRWTADPNLAAELNQDVVVLDPPVAITGTDPATVPLTVTGAPEQLADVVDINGPVTGHPSVLRIKAGAEQDVASGDDFFSLVTGDNRTVLIANTAGQISLQGYTDNQIVLDVFRHSGGSVGIARFRTDGSGSVQVGPDASLSVTTASGSATAPLTINVPGGGGSVLLALTSAGALTLGAATTVQDDLVVGGASGALAILNKGTDGQVLTVDATTHHLKWNTLSAVPAFAAPTIVLGTAAAAGVASTVIRSDATVVAFDATAPVTQAFADAAATGAAAVAARRDHKHGMPVTPATTNFNAGADQTGSRNITGSSTTNGTRRRRVFVTATMVGAATGTVELTYTTTVGGTTLTSVHGPKVSVAFTGVYQMNFVADPGAAYSVNTVTTGTGASATLVQWIEVDE